MKFLEFKRKDGKPLFAQARSFSHWTESTENSNYCTAWIGGKEHTLGHTTDEVSQILAETDNQETPTLHLKGGRRP
jgi:hypothetical protein